MENDGLKRFSQSYDKAYIKKMFNSIVKDIANETGRTEEEINDQINKINIGDELSNKIVSELEKAEKILGNKSLKISSNLFKNLFNADSAKAEIKDFVNVFIGEMESLINLKNQINNDKIFMNINDGDLDELMNKLSKLNELKNELNDDKNKRGSAKSKAEFNVSEAEIDYNKNLIKTLNNVIKSNPELSNEVNKIYKQTADSLKQTIEKYNINNESLKKELQNVFNNTFGLSIKSNTTQTKKDFKDFIGYYQSALKNGLDIKSLDPENKMQSLFDNLMKIDYYKTFADDLMNDFFIDFKSIENAAKNAGNGIGEGFGESKEEIDNLIKSIQKLIDKLNEISEMKGVSEKFNDAFSEFKGSLDNQDWDFPKLRESLLDIVEQFKISLSEVKFSSGQLDQVYDMLKGWNDASAATVKATSNKDRERMSFLNRDTGKISNSYFYDAEQSFSTTFAKELIKISTGVSGKLGEIYDTWVHSHPIQNAIKGIQTKGSDIGFSIEDLNVMLKNYIEQGIKKMMVTSNYKYTELDLTEVSKEKFQEIISLFQEELKKAGVIVENGHALVGSNLISTNVNGKNILDLDKKANILNTALQNAILKSGSNAVLNTGNIEDLKMNLSQIEDKTENTKEELQEFLNVLKNISKILTEINEKGFKFNNDENLNESKNIKNKLEKENNKEFIDLTPNVENFEAEANKVLEKIDLEKEVELKPVIKNKKEKTNSNIIENSNIDNNNLELNPDLDYSEWIIDINNTIEAIRTKINPIKVNVKIDTENVDISEEDINKLTENINAEIKAIYNKEQQMRQSAGKEVSSIKAIIDAVQELSDLISKVPALNINAEELKKILSNAASYEALIKSDVKTKETNNSNKNNKKSSSKNIKVEGVSLSELNYTEEDLNDIYQAAKKANAALTDTVKIVEQIRKDSQDKYAQSFIVTDDKGNKATVNRTGKYYTGQKIVRDDIKEQKEQIKLAKEQQKEQESKKNNYTSWWEKALKERDKIQQKRDKEIWDNQVKDNNSKYLELQNQEYIKLENTVKEYGELRVKIAKNNGIATEEEINKLKELENRIDTISNEIVDKNLYSEKKDNSIIENLYKYDDYSYEEQEKAIKKIVEAQIKAYTEIRSLQTNLVKLDPDKNANEYKATTERIKTLQQEIATNQKILNQNKEYYSQQELTNELLSIREKTQVRIGRSQDNINSKSKDSTLPTDKNYKRVVDLYYEYLDVLKEIKSLEIKQKDPNLSNEELTQISDEIDLLLKKKVDLESQYNNELDSEYTKTVKIREVLDAISENKKKASSANLVDVDFDEKAFVGGMSKEQAEKVNVELARTDSLMNKINASKSNISGFETPFNKASVEIKNLNEKLLNNAITLDQYKEKVNKTAQSLNSIVAVLDPLNDEDTLKQSLTDIINARYGQKFSVDDIDFTRNQKTGNLNAIVEVIDIANKKAYDLKTTLDGVNGTVIDFGLKPKKFSNNWTKFIDELTVKFRNLGTYLLSFVGFYEVWGQIKQGVTYVRELDTALTEMRKVSNETVSSLKEFQKVSFDIADNVGTTASTIQNSTADWMRLGESIDEATESAKTSNILLNVSEFEDISSATDALVSVSQAYKDFEKIDIVDKMNNIGNNYSIATDGIATALQDSASALTTAGNSLDEAIALVTAGNSIVQDPNSVGSGLRTIALRLTGTEESKEALEELGEEADDVITTASKLRDTIMSATKVSSNGFKGFDIFDENGNYKSTYEILQGIADVYNEIVETDKKTGSNNVNLLLETLAGINSFCLKFVETHFYRTHLIALIA